MPGKQADTPSSMNDADFAKAYQELNRGEQTAAALEQQLSAMERKIDELLAAAEQNQKEIVESMPTNGTSEDVKQKQ